MGEAAGHRGQPRRLGEPRARRPRATGAKWSNAGYGMIERRFSTWETPGAAQAARSASLLSAHERTLPRRSGVPTRALSSRRAEAGCLSSWCPPREEPASAPVCCVPTMFLSSRSSARNLSERCGRASPRAAAWSRVGPLTAADCLLPTLVGGPRGGLRGLDLQLR